MASPPPPELGRWYPLISVFLQRLGTAWYMAGRPQLFLTSWFRDAEMNAASGGHPFSQHLVACAVDVDGAPEAIDAMRQASANQGLFPVREPTHLHIQMFPAGYLERLSS